MTDMNHCLGDLLIDDEEDTTAPLDVEEEAEDQEEDSDTVEDDPELKEDPGKIITVKFNQSTFSRPSCRGLDRCTRTDLVFLTRDKIKKETPVAMAERTPIKAESFAAHFPGIPPAGIPGMPLPGSAAAMMPPSLLL